MAKRHTAIVVGVVISTLIICAGSYAAWRYQRTSPERPSNKYTGNIIQLHSQTDADGDGLDDQVDILQSALTYVSTRPKYQSKYYSSGYPNDGYGVCTDVVAFALRDAGYDLMALVNNDIVSNPDDYDITEPDVNIDFRRVKNLQIYFEHNATSLTTDISQIEQWQGGDIVVFNNHIGIVSDHRNSNGIPHIIHHNSPWQKTYEEDILETRNDIVGHYRIGQLAKE